MNTSGEPLRKKPKRSSNFVHVVAPGQRKKLSFFLTEENHDINAFPDLFPNGKGGLHDKTRKRKISAVQNYNQKTLNHDRRFAEDADFLFVAQQALEKHSFENQITISTQRGVASNTKNGLKNNSVIDIFKTVVGTPMYFKKFRNEIFARMEQLGPFHFFVTLSAAEMHWPEVTTSILHIQGKKIIYQPGWEKDEDKITILVMENNKEEYIPLSEYKKRFIRNKTDFFKNNFFLITRMFNARVKAFIKLMTADGKFSHYSYRIEFQLRGMPHLHGVFWLNENEIKDCIDENGQYKDENVVELIDKWISCSLNTGNEKLNKLIKDVNVHGHTNSCSKGKTSSCRFDFPKLPSRRTLIAHPPLPDTSEERVSKLKEILKVVKKKLEIITDAEIADKYENDLEKFLEDINICLEDYEEALSTSHRGKIVVLKRTLHERNVNNYNKEFIFAWKANMDIQFCYDGYAVVTYLTDYISKGDAEVTQALKKAVSETKDCDDMYRLNYVKRVYFTHKQTGVAEATYRLTPGLNLIGSNVKTIFAATGYPKNRSHFYKKVQDEDEADFESDSEEEEEEEEGGDEEDPFQETNEASTIPNKGINIPGRQGKFKKVGTIHQKYAQRPNALREMCFAQFCIMYEYCKKVPDQIVFDDGASDAEGDSTIIGYTEKLPKYIKLNHGGHMRLRGFPLILRIHSSKKKKEPYEDIYSELLLFCPWRNENELRQPSIQEKFAKEYKEIESKKSKIYPGSSMIDEMRELFESSDDTRPMHMLENIDTTGQQQNMDDEEAMEPLDTTELPKEDSQSKNVRSDGIFRPIIVEEDDVMLEMARNLSFEQRIVFDHIIQFCKSILRLMKGATNIIQLPPQLIVTGKVYNLGCFLKYSNYFLIY